MKKKFFAVVLAASMVLPMPVGGGVTAEAATETAVTIGNAFAAGTTPEVLAGNFDVTYTFYNDSDETATDWNNWYNFILEIFDGKGNFIDLRADRFGWTVGNWTLDGDTKKKELTFNGGPADWNQWIEDVKNGCNVTVNVKRTGNVFDVTYKFDNTNKDVIGTVFTINGDVADTVNVRLTGEHVALTDIKFVNNPVATDIPNTDANSSETINGAFWTAWTSGYELKENVPLKLTIE